MCLGVKFGLYIAIFIQQSLDACGMVQHVNEPTHHQCHTIDILVTREANSLIGNINVMDPMLCNEDNVVIKDHYAILATLNVDKPMSESKVIRYRKLRDIDIDQFQRDIILTPQLNNCNLPMNTLVCNLDTSLSSLLDKHAPLCKKTIKIRKRAPWYNSEIQCAKRERRKLERKWRKSLNNTLYCKEFKQQCITVNKLLHKNRVDYYSNKLTIDESDTKTLFKVARKLVGDDGNPTLPSCDNLLALTNQFSDYFRDKIEKLKSNITLKPSQSATYMERSFTGSTITAFEAISREAVNRIIQSSPAKTCDLDPIPTSLLKKCIELTPIITTIVNKSLTSGTYPDIFKEALVRPLLKKKGTNKDELKNYRPVSNLHFISKVIEKAVASQLETHLVRNELLDTLQSGYRAYHSTETAMLKISNDILTNKDHNESTGLVCIDLSAAFDLVDHSILLKRLFDYFGKRGTALAWFKSYLTGRSQRVLIDDVRSDKKQLRQGVPQGSVLGARLYTLYVRPLSDVIQRHSVLYHTYADDTQIYVKFNKNCLTSMQMALCQLEHCIADISCWMSQNGLKLNHEKTEWIIFNGNTNLIKDVELHIGTQTIQQSKVIKNLGVKLNSELTLQSQISDVCRISYYHLRRINKIRKYLTENGVKSLVQALVTGRMDYCNSLYFGLPLKYIAKLQLVQNASARVISKTRKRDHITPVLKALHWIPIKKRTQYKMMLLVFNALHKQGPSYISDYLHWYTPSRPLRSMCSPSLTSARSRSVVIQRRILNGGCSQLWNSLPPGLRSTNSFISFKRQLKTYIFNLP